MQPLKETKVYIPLFGTKKSEITVELSEQTGYFLTKQEMEELLFDVLQEGILMERELRHLKYSEFLDSKQEYIKKLLNNE